MSTLSSPLKGLLLLSALGLAVSQSGCLAKDSQSPLSHSESSSQDAAKNVILFVGDGMGISTITAARIFDGQSQGKLGEEHQLSFETFDHLALIKTYNTNAQVPDSAGTATAMMSGYKTNIGAINVLPKPTPQEMVQASCREKSDPLNLADKAKAKGLSVGVVSTARLTHATPAAMYSHSVSRDWEADRDISQGLAEAGCESISSQLLKSDVDIALGGGSKEFDEAKLQAWASEDGHNYISTSAEMTAAPSSDKLLGLFNRSHMSFEADRAGTKEPSLAEMTAFAIDNLDKRGTGYVLMVESGRIDHAHHGTNAYRALSETQQLSEAVKVAHAKTGDDTLIIVTADHSHVFTMAGYPMRGNPILGLVRSLDRQTAQPNAEYDLAEDGKPYTTLGYQNGPNQRTADSDALTDNMVQAPDFRQQTAVPKGSETHAGEDVALYANGPGAHHFRGVMEQNEIGEIIDDIISGEK